jgi:CRISPR-associated protein Cmr1
MMMTQSGARTYELQALTDIWTGDANTAQSKQPNRLIPTGLLGSVRWWFEVLVRGLGGSPCDPSSKQKTCLGKDHCVVCELFGCTGWARKFRFDVRDAQGHLITSKLTQGTTFHLRFTQLRAVKAEEWALLELTLRLISDFGALGGKTVLKPTDEQHRQNEFHHQDFGLVRWNASATTHTRQQLASYASAWTEKPTVSGAAWASCRNMWFVDENYLARQSASASTFNEVLGRDQRKTCRDCGAVHLPPSKCPKTNKHPKRFSDAKPSSPAHVWLAGGIGESKKVFSFKTPARTFGFVQQTSEFGLMRDTLRSIWSQLATSNDWFVSGDDLLSRLFLPPEAP